MRISPPHSLGTLRVMMLITPPIASEPYSEDIGPHHLDALDGRQRRRPAALHARGIGVGAGLAGVLALAVDQDQRVLGAHAAQADVLAIGAAGDHHAGHFHQRVGHVAVELLSRSWRVITLIEAGASWICCSKPLAVTTTVSMTLARSSPSAQAEAETPAPAAHSATAAGAQMRRRANGATRRRDVCAAHIPDAPVPGGPPRHARRLPASYDS